VGGEGYDGEINEGMGRKEWKGMGRNGKEWEGEAVTFINPDLLLKWREPATSGRPASKLSAIESALSLLT
jgi:hypothetical protein